MVRWLGITFAFAALVVVAWLSGCSPAARDGGGAQAEFLNLTPDVGYVGRDTCRQCHLEIYATFVKTGMGRAFQPMAKEIVVEAFEPPANHYVDPRTNLHYRMIERDGNYWQQQYLVDSSGAEIALDEAEMVWVLGSNNHCRSYVLEIDDRLFQSPACWYPQAERWDMCPGFESDNMHFYREISDSCIHCHNGRMVLEEGHRNKFEQPYPHGIGCERCHGPGQLHVERWKSGNDTPSGGPDNTIVHPRRLSLAARKDVCFNCHLGDAKATERVVRHDVPRDSFLPGMRMTDSIVPMRFNRHTQYDFGLSAQGDRMMMSECYTKSGGKLECLTCHNPHISVYDPDRPVDLFRNKCLTCHATEDCIAPGEQRQATEGLADDCVACHMRKAEPDDQRHTEFTDHWIRRDIDLRERDHRDKHEIEPVFPEEFGKFTEGEKAYFHARAYYLMTVDVEGDERDHMLEQSAEWFQRAIAAEHDTLEAWFFLGKVQRRLGRRTDALQSFETAHALNTTDHDAAFALGQALVAAGDPARALSIFREMLEANPDSVMVLAEIGRTYMELGELDEALLSYEKALEREPWTASLHLNRGMLLAAKGNFDEAEREAETALGLDPDDPAVWEFYGKIKQQQERFAEAIEASRFLEQFRSAAGS